ncbi:hypothetical protein U1Q18_020713 [Sarracenia purpurea var. burkii]
MSSALIAKLTSTPPPSPLSIKATPSGRSCSVRLSSRATTVNNRYRSTVPAREKSFHGLLGVSESGTRQLALKYLPDVSPSERMEENTRRFICIKEALNYSVETFL